MNAEIKRKALSWMIVVTRNMKRIDKSFRLVENFEVKMGYTPEERMVAEIPFIRYL